MGMKQVIGYVRVSTVDQVHNGISLEAQEAKIRAWCTLHDATLVAIYKDEGISGYKGRSERPGLDAALTQVCKLKGALVLYSLARLARNTRETIEIGECLNNCGADLVSLSENIDTTTAAGKMVFRMLAVLAEFERDQVSERTTMAMAHKRSQGLRISGQTPYGTRLAADGKTLEPEPAEHAVVVQVQALRSAGLSIRKIVATLAAEGVTGRTGKPLDIPQVHRIVARTSAPPEKTMAF
jgi:DNA invertase Pin-like site-specific DNA recombinase